MRNRISFTRRKKWEKYKDALKETNSLLKQIWSRKQFIEKNKDLKFLSQKYYEQLKTFFKQF